MFEKENYTKVYIYNWDITIIFYDYLTILIAYFFKKKYINK